MYICGKTTEGKITMNKYFEEKIKGYSCNFSYLDMLVNKKDEAGTFFATVRDSYKKYFLGATGEQKGKFIVRYYKAKKLMYSSAQMFIEAKHTKQNECIVAYYYLMYYALFQAMQSNLIVCVAYDDKKVLNLSHENVKNYFSEQFCKTKKCPLDEGIIKQLEDLRDYREYYSYAMPFNLLREAVVDEKKIEKYIKTCFQLLNFRLFVLWQEVNKSISFSNADNKIIEDYLCESCNRIGDIAKLLDDADIDFLNEILHDGGADIVPISLSYNHDFDEYGTYNNDVYEKLGMPCTQVIVNEAMQFVYSAIF